MTDHTRPDEPPRGARGDVRLVALVAIALTREVPLGGRSGIDIARERATTHDQGATR